MIMAIPNANGISDNSKLPDFRQNPTGFRAKDGNWAKTFPSLKISPQGDTRQYVLDTTGVLGHGLRLGLLF